MPTFLSWSFTPVRLRNLLITLQFSIQRGQVYSEDPRCRRFVVAHALKHFENVTPLEFVQGGPIAVLVTRSERSLRGFPHFLRQTFKIDGGAAEYERPLDSILKFTNVSGPLIHCECGHRFA